MTRSRTAAQEQMFLKHEQEHQAKWATIDQAIGAEQWGNARAQLVHIAVDIIVRAQLSELKRMVSDRSVGLCEHLPPGEQVKVFGDVPDDDVFCMEDPDGDGLVRCIRLEDQAHPIDPCDDAVFYPEDDEPVTPLSAYRTDGMADRGGR